jgi:hypothetical protein
MSRRGICMKHVPVLMILLCLAPFAGAQDPPILASPEVRADRTVLVKLWAPLARVFSSSAIGWARSLQSA